MSPLAVDLEVLSSAELKQLVLDLLGQVAELERRLGEREAEIARLKGLKGKPILKPSGMELATARPAPGGPRPPHRGKGAKATERVIREDRVIPVAVPSGSRFKGYKDYMVQELELRPRLIRFRRQRWLTPDGRTVIAPLPAGITGHVGPELQRFLLMQYHQGQTTVARLAAMLRMLGMDVSKRQLVRLLTERRERFVAEARDVLRSGLETARWISADDTAARHKHRSEVCTQIGDDRFTFFATTASKSRLNFLELLRAGHQDYVINAAALAYMRDRALPEHAIARLAAHPDKQFTHAGAWHGHLRRLGIDRLEHSLEPVRLATEGALWGSIQAHKLLPGTVVISDDAGQFAVGEHALCWVHAERLVHKLDTFTEIQRQAQQHVRALIWWFYADLKGYCRDPTPARKAALRQRFDRIFRRKTGFVTLDRLLARLHANKEELLRVLERPEVPLHDLRLGT